MATQPAVSTVEHGGFTVTSSNPEEVVRESLKQSDPKPAEPEKEAKPDLSKAASELGRKGGKAAAKARQGRESEPEKEQAAKPAETPQERSRALPEASQEDGEEQPEGDQKDKTGDPRHDPKARIAQLARERNEERERRQRLERELAEARRAPRQPEARQEARPEPDRETRPERPAKPQPNEYETYDQYLDARDEYNRGEWERNFVGRVRAHYEATRYAKDIESTASGWTKRLQDAKDADPEFPDKARVALTAIGFPTKLLPEFDENGQRVQHTGANWAADYLTSAGDNARDLLLYLSEHESDLQRIITLESSHDVARELAMIEASLKRPAAATAGTSAERVVSRANPPVTPVTGTPTIADGDIAPKPGESFDQWYARTGKTQKR